MNFIFLQETQPVAFATRKRVYMLVKIYHILFFFLAEQTSVSISDVVFNSATFILNCGLVETDTVMYELLDLTNSTNSSTVLTFSCGSRLTLELMPNTSYTLMQHYGDQACILDGFTTPEQSKCLVPSALIIMQWIVAHACSYSVSVYNYCMQDDM